MTKIIRSILTLLLVYGAYTETGVFTALSLLLIFIYLEVNAVLVKRALDAATQPGKALFDTVKLLRDSPNRYK